MATDDLYTKALFHFDGADGSTTITDESGLSWSVNGNTNLRTASYKFGTASCYFDGSGDYLSTADNVDFQLGSSDFTIDYWIRVNSLSTMYRAIGRGTAVTAATLEFSTGLGSSNNPNIVISSGTSTYQANASGTISSTSTWYHIACVRSGNSLKTALNGSFGSAVDVTGVTVQNLGTVMSIGRVGTYTSANLAGYLDEFRFSKGIARWTSNFTPPTSPYLPAITRQFQHYWFL
jgi:hypothetical protein